MLKIMRVTDAFAAVYLRAAGVYCDVSGPLVLLKYLLEFILIIWYNQLYIYLG